MSYFRAPATIEEKIKCYPCPSHRPTVRTLYNSSFPQPIVYKTYMQYFAPQNTEKNNLGCVNFSVLSLCPFRNEKNSRFFCFHFLSYVCLNKMLWKLQILITPKLRSSWNSGSSYIYVSRGLNLNCGEENEHEATTPRNMCEASVSWHVDSCSRGLWDSCGMFFFVSCRKKCLNLAKESKRTENCNAGK